jgi:hypothetical protein
MPSAYPHPAAIEPVLLLRDCETGRARRSGPGGQNRNKVETAITLCHKPTGVTGAASERRSQHENMGVALFRLRVNLAIDVRLPIDPMATTSDLWRSRVRGGRISLNPRHHDFPAMLAEALDMVAACRTDLKTAARILGCTMSQLVKLLKDEPRAIAWVNAERSKRGLHPYL